jgi:hypothetical protein
MIEKLKEIKAELETIAENLYNEKKWQELERIEAAIVEIRQTIVKLNK